MWSKVRLQRSAPAAGASPGRTAQIARRSRTARRKKEYRSIRLRADSLSANGVDFCAREKRQHAAAEQCEKIDPIGRRVNPKEISRDHANENLDQCNR